MKVGMFPMTHVREYGSHCLLAVHVYYLSMDKLFVLCSMAI